MKKNGLTTSADLKGFRTALRTLVRKINKHIKEDTTCCGIGFLPCHVLLEFEDGKARSLRDLQDAMEMDKAGLSRAVDTLVKAGMLTRRENPDNRRAIIIEATAAGIDKIREVNEGTDEKHRKLFDLIPPNEHATVVCAMSYLAKAYDELDGGDAGCGCQKE
jgi:DNA-binding MarR family transcriptional regulator